MPSRHIANVAHVAVVVIAVAHLAMAMPAFVVITASVIMIAITVVVVVASPAGARRGDEVAGGQAGDPGEGDCGVVGQCDGGRSVSHRLALQRVADLVLAVALEVDQVPGRL